MPAALNVRIDDQTADRLRARAEKDGLSVEDEARKLLQESLQPGWEAFWAKADRISRQLAGSTFEDSTELIREDRDR
jgi:plasmid stability protein